MNKHEALKSVGMIARAMDQLPVYTEEQINHKKVAYVELRKLAEALEGEEDAAANG